MTRYETGIGGLQDLEEEERLRTAQHLWQLIRQDGPAAFCDRFRIPYPTAYQAMPWDSALFDPSERRFRFTTPADIAFAMDVGHPAVEKLRLTRIDLDRVRTELKEAKHK